MSWGKHFVNSEKQIDRGKQITNDFVIINNGTKFINKKSISEIRLIKYRKEFIELAEGQRINPSDFEHLRNPTLPALDQNTFTSLPARDESGNDENNDD